MRFRIAVLAGLLPLALCVPELAAQPGPDPWRCAQQRLAELGYEFVDTAGGTEGAHVAERQVLTALGMAKEAGAVAAWLSMQFRPPVEQRFDRLTLSRDSRGELRVVAEHVVVNGAERAVHNPRAQALKDAYAVLTRCGNGRSGHRR